MNGLSVERLLVRTTSGRPIVEDISFSVPSGQVLGLVGESGSGKSTIGRAILGFARRGSEIAGGAVVVGDRDILSLSPKEATRARGGLVSYIPQDPAAALNPVLRIGTQLEETLAAHDIGGDRTALVRESLEAVGLTGDDHLRRYPHQLSGGQQQRVAIAMAFLCHPSVVVLDEPTTALDVSTQARILTMVRELTTINDVAAVYISHDLAVVREIAQHLVVLYAGRMAETGSAQAVFEAPSHPYTEVLLRAIPDVELPKRLPIVTGHAPQPGERPPGCAFAPRCSMAVAACSVAPPPVNLGAGHLSFCHRTQDVVRRPDVALAARAVSAKESVLQVQGLSVGYAGRDVVRAVDFELFKGECLALVGESGSGKTTLSKAVVGLLEPSEGTVRVMGETVAPRARDRSQQMRRTLQYIFQSPYNSLNPRHTIGDILRRPLQLFFPVSNAEARERAVAALRRVALTPAVVDRYPNQLSGGERQRVAIARALVCDPSVLVCDEITSALDVSVQASIVDLLYRLREESGLSLLFVTHNLALVRSIADEVCVLKDGVVVETGEVADVLSAPEADYTRALLDDTPRLVGATMLEE